jgi:hypothetical protein
MFAVSFVIVALSAGALLWIFGRQSPLLARFARSAPEVEVTQGRTRRAGDGLVYHPPATPAPPPLAPPPPLGLSPGYGDADEVEPAPNALARTAPAWAVETEDEEEEDESYDEPETDAGFAQLVPELATAPSARPDPLVYAELASEDDVEDFADAEEEPATQLVAPADKPAAEAGGAWAETAALRLRELDALLGAGGFAAYFAEVRSPHAWDEMIEALRSVGATEAAEIGIDAGETQWPYHEQGSVAPPEAFAAVDARWIELGTDIASLLEVWLDAQRTRGSAAS